MRINHKSDFDFRLDLYAADPYGTAVASGFPDCDFTGKLFIGPMVRSRQCYIFSKSNDKLDNCFDNDGHIHVVVSNHNLGSGPLYCELTLRVPDSHYPGGYRSVVYNFPLNLYLTDSDAEQISPTVSVTMPLIIRSKTIVKPPVGDDPAEPGTEDIVPSNRANSRFAEPWLSPRVCGGLFRSGAYAGNVYRNNGKMYLSGNLKLDGHNGSYKFSVYLPRLCSLTGKSQEEIIAKIKTSDNSTPEFTIKYNHIIFEFTDNKPGYYIEIPSYPYVTITPDCTLKFFYMRPLPDYLPKNLSLEDIQRNFTLYTRSGKGIFEVRTTSSFVIQQWKKRLRKVLPRAKSIWCNPRIKQMNWVTKKHGYAVALRPILFRAARKANGKLSSWTYFTLVFNHELQEFHFYLTNEAGQTLNNRWSD